MPRAKQTHPLNNRRITRRHQARLWLLLASLSGWGCTMHRSIAPASMLVPPPAPHASSLWTESFETLSPQQWREVSLTGHTAYRAVEFDGRPCLRAESHAAASILLHAVRFNPHAYPWISWSWRVERMVDGEDLARSSGSDAPGRVYVYFNTWGLPWQKRSVDYVWSAMLPIGNIVPSPFSPASKLLIADGGRAAVGQWRTVERNLVEDYTRCFGSRPPDVVAIGLMTDTDSTGHESLAYYGQLRISRDRPSPMTNRTAQVPIADSVATDPSLQQ